MKFISVVVVFLLAICTFSFHYFKVSTPFYPRSHQVNNQSNISFERRLTFERWGICNINQREPCYRTNKSLVVSFWSEKSKSRWMPGNILSAFPAPFFDQLIFVYDNSSWHSHPGYDHFILIHVKGQIRFWYVKRFLLPSMIKPYKYVWIVDDDSQLNFNPLHYECVIERLNISLSAPARSAGAWSHPITQKNEAFVNRVGRWTDFVETGPAFVASSAAWLCIYEYLGAFTGSGWGLDLIWCKMLADRCFPSKDPRRICAILDAFTIDHQSTGMNSNSYGAPELPYYTENYRRWHAQMKNYDPLASNTSVVDRCRVLWSTLLCLF